MPKRNLKLDDEIDVGQFLLILFDIFFVAGILWLFVWFYINVYNPKERAFINAARYAYSKIQAEAIILYEEQGYIFNSKDKEDDTFCKQMITKHSKGKGSCVNVNPNIPLLNFQFKGKRMTVYGLEKPFYKVDGVNVKDIIIDTDGEKRGENKIGSDRIILRLYSTGRLGGMLTPVNCNKKDEQIYGFKMPVYCIGTPEINYLATNKPLGFDVEQIGGNRGRTRVVNKNVSFLRADCSAFGGDLLGFDDYCSDKMFYWLRGCYDDYMCNVALTK